MQLKNIIHQAQKEIRKNLNIIEILTEKNLPNQLDKVIAKSKTLADKEKSTTYTPKFAIGKLLSSDKNHLPKKH